MIKDIGFGLRLKEWPLSCISRAYGSTLSLVPVTPGSRLPEQGNFIAVTGVEIRKCKIDRTSFGLR